jgi:hypothetical protein
MTTWKDKRIEAINKIIKANPKSAKARNRGLYG